jgi:hypothetical protein
MPWGAGVCNQRTSSKESCSRRACGGKDAKIGGVVETVRQGGRAGQVDEINLAVAPVIAQRGRSTVRWYRPSRPRLLRRGT